MELRPEESGDAPASLLASNPDPTVITGPDQRIVDANLSAGSLFGYPSGELVGRSLEDLVPALTARWGVGATADAAPVLGRHRDGTTMRLRVSFRAIPMDRQLTAASFQPDEPAPVEMGEEGALGRLPIAVLRFNRWGRVLYANARASELTGRPRGELRGQRPEDFAISTATARTWAAVLDEVIRTGEPSHFEVQVGTPAEEWWFEANVIPEREVESEPTALVAAFDITAHRQAAAQLEASEARFRRLAEGSQDLVSQHLADGRFLYASPAARQVLGLDPRQAVGRRLGALVEPEDRKQVEEALRAAAAGERPQPVSFQLTRPDGSPVSCEMTVQGADPCERGEPTVICITRDISERVRGEEILRAASRMEAAATLAAGVAHDFNNLMTGILGNAELLLADPSFPDQPSRLAQIADAAKRGGALAQQLLAYARGGKYQTSSVAVNEIVHQCLHLQKHAFPPRILLEEDLAGDVPPIEADPVQIGQVITNLCINAAEAIAGTGRVTVRTRRVDLDAEAVAGKPGLAAGVHLLLEVHDTGGGIDPAIVPRIFEPFFSTKFQGRGLGLAAAYGIVKNHRGFIGVASEPGRGTVFSIYFPAGRSPARTTRPPQDVFPTGDETILLVDDDEGVVDVTRAILERLRYRVLVARHGIEAVEIARTYPGPIHLALLDMGMPLAGGAEAFPFLKSARPDMRVLIASGYEMDEVVEGLLAAGADAFLQKPYRVSGLARGIRAVLDRRVRSRRLED
jgi:PAS domain S-box-containing protein